MNKLNFEPNDCSKVRDLMDAYLSDELLVETNQQILSHIDKCESCASVMENRKRARHLLRRAVDNQAVPTGLEQKIKLNLRKQNPARMTVSNWRALAIAASMTVALLGGWAVYHLIDHPDPVSAFNVINVVSEQGLALLQIGAQDHIKCAIDHHMKERKFTAEMMTEQLGPEYAGLVNVIQQKMPTRYSLAIGHRCTVNGREYVHFILREGDHTISVILTKKQGESFASTPEKVEKPSKENIYESRVRGYDVASFEAPNYLGFVVSDTGETETVQLAADLAATVKDFLSNRRTDMSGDVRHPAHL
jgi:hypothetical protein